MFEQRNIHAFTYKLTVSPCFNINIEGIAAANTLKPAMFTYGFTHKKRIYFEQKPCMIPETFNKLNNEYES